MANEFDSLFSGNLEGTLDFLNEKKKQTSQDGILRIDLSKAKDIKKGYRLVIRLLPNLTSDGKLGPAAIEKIAHYVDIKEPRELSGWFDSPKNFGDKCPLTDLYYQMTNGKNAIMVEKAKSLNFSRKYYSYALVLEDENQPENVGKIMIFQYGKTIKDKIRAEKDGDITGVSCNVFDLVNGKDLVVIVKEVSNFPDYKMSAFRQEPSPIKVYNAAKAMFKEAPVVDGRIHPEAQGLIKDFLMSREFELEDFAPKRLTEEQQAKISEITAFLTGKASSTYTKAPAAPTSDDFELDGFVSSGSKATTTTTTTDEDDFFADFN